MLPIQNTITGSVQAFLQEKYNLSEAPVELQSTRKDFEGDITIVVFPLLRHIKNRPEVLGEEIGLYLKENLTEVEDFNVVKGFLNIVLSDQWMRDTFYALYDDKRFGFSTKNSKASIMVEYSSPNTNKPLHLGHIRNNLLGYSVAEILKANGHRVYKTQIINDRGIHICKSMLAYQRYGNGETPESTGIKGDKFVGDFYVAFDKDYRKEIDELVAQGLSPEEAKDKAPSIIEARKMLQKWEQGDPEVRALWNKMNQWVYEGFNETYRKLGVDFDKNYYESDTYLLGKDVVEQGLEQGVFYRKDDGSVWIDLSGEGLDEKLVLRSDGTAVYITQDIGTAIQRRKDFPDIRGMVYTVGNEQDYHFKVLFLILKRLGFDWADNLYHLSYGMVDLPHGKMKSREGTVVDADDLMEEMKQTAKKIAGELGKLEGYSEEEKEELYHIIGMGALKYFLLKVDPKKRILFNPEESVDFHGNTGPFIQYTYARIRSLMRKAGFDYSARVQIPLHKRERELIKRLTDFPSVVQEAAGEHSPALIANYTYELVKLYNSLYQSLPILSAEHPEEKIFRIQLSEKVSAVIKDAFALLGIQMPERM